MSQGSRQDRTPRIFLSYAVEDRARAEQLAAMLRQSGANLWFDAYEPVTGEPLARVIEREISAADYLVVLLSDAATKSAWVQAELAFALNKDLQQRGVTIVPVRLDECQIPEPLRDRYVWDLSADNGRVWRELTETLRVAGFVDFESLGWREFEDLVCELLSGLGFSVERATGASDNGIDAIARLGTVNPFGVAATEAWAVEIKFYSHSKPGLEQVHQFVGRLSTFPGRRGLLVTNGQLTSAALRWLASSSGQAGWTVRVVDGSELRSLLLRHPGLVQRWFGPKPATSS